MKTIAIISTFLFGLLYSLNFDSNSNYDNLFEVHKDSLDTIENFLPYDIEVFYDDDDINNRRGALNNNQSQVRSGDGGRLHNVRKVGVSYLIIRMKMDDIFNDEYRLPKFVSGDFEAPKRIRYSIVNRGRILEIEMMYIRTRESIESDKLINSHATHIHSHVCHPVHGCDDT